MKKRFEISLEYLIRNSRYLPEDVQKLLNVGIDTSKPNVSYWIYCLHNLILYYLHDVNTYNRYLKQDEERLSASSIRSPLHVAKTKDSRLMKIRDRLHSIEACSIRLVRDAK